MQSVEAPEAESSPPRAFFGLSDMSLNSVNTLRLSEEDWLSAEGAGEGGLQIEYHGWLLL